MNLRRSLSKELTLRTKLRTRHIKTTKNINMLRTKALLKKRNDNIDYTLLTPNSREYIENMRLITKPEQEFINSSNSTIVNCCLDSSMYFNPGSKSIYHHTPSPIPQIQIPLIKHSAINYHTRIPNSNSRSHFIDALISQLATYTEPVSDYLSLSLIVIYEFKDYRTFDGAILLSYSLLLSKQNYNYLLPFFLQKQNNCMNHILKSLQMNLNDNNVVPILTVSIALSLSSLFLNQDIDIYEHQKEKFSNGPTCILKKVCEDRDKFPMSFPILEKYGESL